MRRVTIQLIAAALLALSSDVWAELERQPSSHAVAETANRFEEAVRSKGAKVFARIDHGAGARSVGLELRPTVVVVFGNPRLGTPLMRCAQSTGIDLPLRALIWEDASGRVWVGYEPPREVAARHGVESCGDVLVKMEGALKGFARAAASP